MNEIEKLTTEHDLFISIGLKVPIKPSVFAEDINTLLFENIGYMNSWGVHTKNQYIEICNNALSENAILKQEIEQLKADKEALSECVRWYADIENNSNGILQRIEYPEIYITEYDADGGEIARECIAKLGGTTHD